MSESGKPSGVFYLGSEARWNENYPPRLHLLAQAFLADACAEVIGWADAELVPEPDKLPYMGLRVTEAARTGTGEPHTYPTVTTTDLLDYLAGDGPAMIVADNFAPMPVWEVAALMYLHAAVVAGIGEPWGEMLAGTPHLTDLVVQYMLLGGAQYP